MKCGEMDIDILACDDGSDAWREAVCPATNRACEGSLPPARLRRFPRIDMIEFVID